MRQHIFFYSIWAVCGTLLFASTVIPTVNPLLAVVLVVVSIVVVMQPKHFQQLMLLLCVMAVIITYRFFIADVAYTMNAFFTSLAQQQQYITPLHVTAYPAMYEGTFYGVCSMLCALYMRRRFMHQQKRAFILFSSILLLLQLLLQATPNIWIAIAYYASTLLILMIFSTERAIWRYVVMSTLLLFATLASVAYVMPNENKAYEYVTHMWHEWRYTTDESVTMPEGKLSAMASRPNGEHTALTIAMEQPAAMYLRGFVGSAYANNEWAPLLPETYLQEKRLFEALTERHFTPTTQLLLANTLVETQDTAIVSIQNHAANSRYVYAPYELAQPLEQVKTIDYAMHEATALRGSRQYTYDVMTSSYIAYPQLAEQLKNVERAMYFDYEKHYRAYVDEMFTPIQDEDRTLLQHHMKALPTIETYEQAIRFVQQFVDQQIAYDEAVEKAADTDFLQHVLEEEKTGYAPHFATVATLLFRTLDIPARYVEGYIVTPENVKQASAFSEIEVLEQNAHAWTEIYVDTIGWVPVEVTPPYKEVMPAVAYMQDKSPLTSSATTVEQAEQQNQTPLQVQKPEEAPPLPEEQAAANDWPMMNTFMLAFVVLLLLVALLFAYKRTKRLRKFTVASHEEAVITMYSYVQHMIRTCPIDEALAQQLAKGRTIYEKAMYSADTINTQERQYMRRLFTIAYRYGKKHKKIQEKLPFMWRYM